MISDDDGTVYEGKRASEIERRGKGCGGGEKIKC
jgi:hypothetical protein